MKLTIKNMISDRCKVLVQEELENLGIRDVSVTIGEAEIHEKITLEQYEELKYQLLNYGLQIVEDKKAILIERIKNTIIHMIHSSEEIPKTKYSCYLSKMLDHDYTYMANLFSELEGMTIEQYIIANKIERVKELIIFDELTLTEIAYRLHYSSVAHLSNQFKKITGFTPSFFKSSRRPQYQRFDPEPSFGLQYSNSGAS
jgi:AraC-like DNA-binding protein